MQGMSKACPALSLPVRGKIDLAEKLAPHADSVLATGIHDSADQGWPYFNRHLLCNLIALNR
jgi:hypothetical protein